MQGNIQEICKISPIGGIGCGKSCAGITL